MLSWPTWGIWVWHACDITPCFISRISQISKAAYVGYSLLYRSLNYHHHHYLSLGLSLHSAICFHYGCLNMAYLWHLMLCLLQGCCPKCWPTLHNTRDGHNSHKHIFSSLMDPMNMKLDDSFLCCLLQSFSAKLLSHLQPGWTDGLVVLYTNLTSGSNWSFLPLFFLTLVSLPIAQSYFSCMSVSHLKSFLEQGGGINQSIPLF